MRIRRMLLIAFLLLLFLTAAPLVALSFFASRAALEAEIGRNLKRDATMLMAQIDMLLFERLQNIHSWSHLDILQEGRIGDVDKRLAQFLAELGHSYRGVYRNLFYLDAQNRIVAAGDPETIGQTFRPHAPWIQAEVPNGEAFIEELQLQPPYTQADMLIRAPVHDRYAPGDIGQLYGVYDLAQIFRLFDQASHAASGERFVILLDARGRTIAASATLREQGLLLAQTFADWLPAEHNGLFTHGGVPLAQSPVLVGYAASKDHASSIGRGWSLLVIQSTAQAFQPIRELWWLFGAMFLAIVLLAAGTALWVAGRISKPLIGLTAWARQFRQTVAGPGKPKVSGALEVRELGAAFGQLLEDLENSRQQVIHAAKLSVVGEMAAIMAHEVRTPLGILHTSAQMLHTETGLSAEGRELTQFILEEGVRLDRLISTLLECAKPRPPEMRLQDLHAVVQRAAALLAPQAKKKMLTLELALSAGDALIECDGELLMQVFLNLLLNAIQHVPNGGHIRVASRNERQGIAVTLEDDGPGIVPENRARLFDPFFTTREGGVGLGLTVTRQIVAAHHGGIDASESRWGGACFTIVLPFRQGIKA
jgi:signal transduction histidine kinase